VDRWNVAVVAVAAALPIVPLVMLEISPWRRYCGEFSASWHEGGARRCSHAGWRD